MRTAFRRRRITIITQVLAGLAVCGVAVADSLDHWRGDLSPIGSESWSPASAGHVLERAGFGGTPEDIAELYALGPDAAVRRLVYFEGVERTHLAPFDHSGIFQSGLDPFPASRPATTKAARETGEALGVRVKEGGNRPIQPIVNQFFYWLRASRLETDRVAYWWANRMLASPRPLEEKMALFWHGHFATNEDKVRDYRKMLQQLELFQSLGLGDFRTLLIGVAKNPAMLAFLDAGVNVKGAPNENFAREIMELFTMGVGHYSETDVREAARAFTGWNYRGLDFHIDESLHDGAAKTVLGRTGEFDGEDVIDIILAQDVTAEFLAAKIYRYFVREELDGDLQRELGRRLRSLDYRIGPFLALLFSSKDFHSSVGTRIKPPVELVVSTYLKLGLTSVPGIPDFNLVTGGLGQRLLHPPTVAGWSGGRSWITPGLLFERGNFVLDVVFPDIGFIPPDRYPTLTPQIIPVHERLRAGMDITNATRPVGIDARDDMMAASNLLADRDEAFNTRYGSYRGWQMAIERVKPIDRSTARLDLAAEIDAAGLTSPAEVVDFLAVRFLSVELDPGSRDALVEFLVEQLGTADITAAVSYLEEPLRMLLHLMLSLPEYQLG
jgi:hypothetical protein